MMGPIAIAPPMDLPFGVVFRLPSFLLTQFKLILVLLLHQSNVVIEVPTAEVDLIEDEEKHKEDDGQEDCESSPQILQHYVIVYGEITKTEIEVSQDHCAIEVED